MLQLDKTFDERQFISAVYSCGFSFAKFPRSYADDMCQDTMPTDARWWMKLACVLYSAHPSAQTN